MSWEGACSRACKLKNAIPAGDICVFTVGADARKKEKEHNREINQHQETEKHERTHKEKQQKKSWQCINNGINREPKKLWLFYEGLGE